ncbi:MAG: hypothetical protein FP816_01525 [Desulfobacteraceae bacterium]|nr:hypothetical protein [Desulfobacteraceae bacterium]MBU4001762.1 hypothetical protein [Pseudomonadota bacterium]MBU4054962.1 hypothetical protein [Pseudomonadota bacterium]
MQRKTTLKIIFRALLFTGIFLLAALPASPANFISGDIEKPMPVFTREGDTLSAKLIPRAKTGSVTIQFKVNGGKLEDVKGIDFFICERPEVDVKNFKSALFQVDASGIQPGGEVKVSIVSQFFISSTQYYVFNQTLEKPWMIPVIQNISLPDRVQELIITVKDGGPYDSDGAENGSIQFIGGPRDSFWGYALGTLFIRFFGIFLVLSVLMIGMILSGKFFSWYLSRKSGSGNSSASKTSSVGPILSGMDEPGELPVQAGEEKAISGPTAAAIALALHLHLSSSKARSMAGAGGEQASNAWTRDGRSRMMNDRLAIYKR